MRRLGLLALAVLCLAARPASPNRPGLATYDNNRASPWWVYRGNVICNGVTDGNAPGNWWDSSLGVFSRIYRANFSTTHVCRKNVTTSGIDAVEFTATVFGDTVRNASPYRRIPAGDLTLNVVSKSANGPASTAWETLVAQSDAVGNNNRWNFGWGLPSCTLTTLNLRLISGGVTTCLDFGVARDNVNYHSYTLVRSGNTYTLWVDGALADTAVSAVNVVFSGDSSYFTMPGDIGNYGLGGPTNYPSVSIAQAAMFNTALDGSSFASVGERLSAGARPTATPRPTVPP